MTAVDGFEPLAQEVTVVLVRSFVNSGVVRQWSRDAGADHFIIDIRVAPVFRQRPVGVGWRWPDQVAQRFLAAGLMIAEPLGQPELVMHVTAPAFLHPEDVDRAGGHGGFQCLHAVDGGGGCAHRQVADRPFPRLFAVQGQGDHLAFGASGE